MQTPALSDVEGPFDRRLRRVRRDRAARRFDTADYLHRHAADELLDRLGTVRRGFVSALDLGCAGGYLSSALRQRGLAVTSADAGRTFAGGHKSGVQCDEDRLPFGDACFDLVVSVGVFDTVNDLPGALTLIRRILRPDGLFLGAFAGAGSLPALRAAMAAADSLGAGGIAARIHPQIDVRAAGDLLARAGFALPVADIESIDVRFDALSGLVADLRAMAATNVLGVRPRVPLGRRQAAAAAHFKAAADPDCKVAERFEIIYVTGWKPPSASSAVTSG